MSVESHNPEEIIGRADGHRDRVYDNVRDASDWFHDRVGGLLPREDAQDQLQDDLDVEPEIAHSLITELVGDLVDPVIQVNTTDGRFVGIVDFHEYEGAYGYTDYDDVDGRRPRVVCVRCVEQAERDNQVSHATAGEGNMPGEASYQDLYAAVMVHYDEQHDVEPDGVETGASLASGTTVNSNTAWHDGNVSGTGAASITSTAVDVSSIGTGDLGFDTATQTELGNHASDSDAHHTKGASTGEKAIMYVGL